MSAFFVEKRCIDVIVHAAAHLGLHYRAPGVDVPVQGNETLIGRILWQENAASVISRYSLAGSAEAKEYEVEFSAYAYEHPGPVKDGASLKQVDCYSYQSCEHRGWESSAAKRLTDEIELILGTYRDDPAYKAAPWGANDQTVAHCL